MTVRELQNEILRLKKERGVFILAHSYERHEILEIADVTGDSYRLATAVKGAKEDTVLMCGVRFMAETVKILAPEKRVILSEKDAGCPMADELTPELLGDLQKKYPNAVTAAYINTTARVKAMSDVCVTSSSAVKVLSRLPEKEILFVPDCNLGSYCAKSLPEKTFHFFDGGCPVHKQTGLSDVLRAKEEHPNALILVHPECLKEVTDKADYIGSTSGIMDFAKKSSCKEFIIGTENTIVEHLQYECPDKKFYPLSKKLICEDMRLTTLKSVYDCLLGGGEEIILDEPLRLAAKKCIDKMIELGG
ncbi:MAG: quinolinate synthase NadA [Clostridia bacterium]|nr:quinolinate synthase NadA [Clostridia bacterium]